MVVWPSIGAYSLGRLVGRLCDMRIGYGFFMLGKLFALLTIPLSLAVYAWKILPFICPRYRLTNRRIVIQKGYSAKDVKSVAWTNSTRSRSASFRASLAPLRRPAVAARRPRGSSTARRLASGNLPPNLPRSPNRLHVRARRAPPGAGGVGRGQRAVGRGQ